MAGMLNRALGCRARAGAALLASLLTLAGGAWAGELATATAAEVTDTFGTTTVGPPSDRFATGRGTCNGYSLSGPRPRSAGRHKKAKRSAGRWIPRRPICARATVGSPGEPITVVLSSDGKFLYVGYEFSDEISELASQY